MRKFLLLLVAIFFLFTSQAQLSESENLIARNLVNKNKDMIGLSAESLNNYIVSSTFDNLSSNCRMVYLQQTYKGIPVYNQMLVLAFRNGGLLSKAGVFNPSFEKFVNNTSGIPSRSAESAVEAAIMDRGLRLNDVTPTIINRSSKGDFVEYNDWGVSRENITAQLIWAPIENSTDFHLAWQVYIIPKTTPDYWMVRVDAADSKIIGVDNYTDYDHWGTPSADGKTETSNNAAVSVKSKADYKQIFYYNDKTKQEDLITTATYRVIPFPAESPIHPGGAPALRTDPWTAGSANATTLKWNTGAAAADYDYSRGNNVWAYQDQANSNTGTIAKSASSTTALPNLTFDFVPNFTVAPTQTTPVPNQQFNTTNLFYWNNIIHDVFYNYGFTEVGGNFQDDNLGRGGLGNDHVNAEAQDGSGTNNANFSTPPDGGSGRMQMFLWTGSPQIDGDVDNGVIVHEHGHGISNRSTGGPGNTSCLGNSEQGGEGWSDYLSLMLTQDWAVATVSTGFNSPRGIGTYVLNQPITGVGIRPKRYTTNFAINGDTYANLPGQVIPHGVGYIWCTMLWEMTWELINTIGTIDPNIYNATGTGGNVVALRLVMEGMRLQPCGPGFVDAKNAILQADMNLYGGANQCAIIRAFARRGLGVNALQGSASSITDGTPDFTGGGPVMSFTQSGVAGVPEGQNIVYNHAITANCQAITSHTLRDTLPLNVSFVSATNGGTYDAGTRVVAWPINLAINATGNYGLTVNINPGSYFPPIVLINDVVTSTTIDPFWTPASTTANVWIAHNVRSHSAPNSFFTPNASLVSDQTLATTNSFAIGATPPTLSFWHQYASESTFDGGVLEISTNGGGTWADIGEANMTQNPYNATISVNFSSPILGRRAWSGTSGAFVETKVNMTPYANQPTVKLRWRFASDLSVSSTGWNVDDIQMQTIATVNLRSSLFNAADVRIDIKDTVTVILPIIIANPTVTINQAVAQPDPTNISPINFTVVFDQPVIGFATGDVTLSGTAGGALVATVTGSGANYNVAVTGMTTSGSVIATIAGGVCTNAALDPNQASTSTDNTVNYTTAPLNDDCANAFTIACGQTLTGSTATATNDFPPAPNCQGLSTAPGVWYKFIGNGGSTTISLCGSSYDTKLFVYSGTCGALVCEGFNDDFCGLQSELTIPTTAGVTYYALIHGFAGSTGAYNISLTCTCPTLSVNPVANQIVCNGGATTAVNFTGLEPATVYTWANNTPSIGLSASGTGNIASFTATNTGATAITATITVTPTYTGCPDGPSTTFTYTVNPTPNAIATPASQTICSGSAITNIVLTGGVTGTTYTWTRNNTATVTGIAASGASSPISGTLTNTTAAPITVTFTITPTANGCPGPTSTATVLVNPTPVAVATPSSQNACSGAAITTIVLTSTTAGTTYAWTRDNNATVTGIAASGTGNISGALTNTTTAPVTVTFTITPTANGCPGAPITATVTVNPTPQVDQPASQTVCNGTMTAPVNFTTTVPGTTYSWANNTPSIGLAASGNGNIAAFTATNVTTLPVTATVTVTPQFALAGPVVFTGSLGAPDATLTQRITRDAVSPTCAVPKAYPGLFATVGSYLYDTYTLVNTTGASQCVTVSYIAPVNSLHVSAYNGSFNPASQGTNYIADGGSSSVNGSTVTFSFTAPAGATIVLVAMQPQNGQATPNYTVTVTGLPQSCTGPSKTFSITVNPTPTITCPANITTASDVGVCNKTVTYTPTVTGTPVPTLSYVFTGATTGSGAGSGSGLKFNVGVTTVTVTATNTCATVTCSFTITVTDSQLPTITTQPANRTVCAGSTATFTVVAVTAPSAGGPIAYQWQLWNGSTWNNIAGATAATLTLNSVTQSMNTNSYRVQLTGLCSTVFSGFATLYVNPLPTINLTTSIPPALLPTQVLTITATTAPSGGSYVWFKNGVVIPGATGNTLSGLTVSDIGTYRVVYTDPNGCVATSANVDITGQPSNNLYVYPVPNQGVFNVRFYNQANEQVTVRVFDAKGAEVYSRKVLTTIPYTTINVDLSTSRLLTSGTYIVDVRGADGRLVGSRKIIVYNR